MPDREDAARAFLAQNPGFQAQQLSGGFDDLLKSAGAGLLGAPADAIQGLFNVLNRHQTHPIDVPFTSEKLQGLLGVDQSTDMANLGLLGVPDLTDVGRASLLSGARLRRGQLGEELEPPRIAETELQINERNLPFNEVSNQRRKEIIERRVADTDRRIKETRDELAFLLRGERRRKPRRNK